MARETVNFVYMFLHLLTNGHLHTIFKLLLDFAEGLKSKII